MAELLLERGEKQVWLEVLEQAADFALPFRQQPYVGVLWSNLSRPPSDQREFLTNALIASGCRYLVCGGSECELWHDFADEAYLALDPECANENAFVTTTWHDQESEEDVVFFFLTCTHVEKVKMNRYLIVQVGKNENQSKLFGQLVRKLGSAEWAA